MSKKTYTSDDIGGMLVMGSILLLLVGAIAGVTLILSVKAYQGYKKLEKNNE